MVYGVRNVPFCRRHPTLRPPQSDFRSDGRSRSDTRLRPGPALPGVAGGVGSSTPKLGKDIDIRRTYQDTVGVREGI